MAKVALAFIGVTFVVLIVGAVLLVRWMQTKEESFAFHAANVRERARVQDFVDELDVAKVEEYGGLEMAVDFHNVVLVEELLHRGADPNHVNRWGVAPIETVARVRDSEFVRVRSLARDDRRILQALVKAGARGCADDPKYGAMPAVAYARKLGNSSAADLIASIMTREPATC